MRILILLMVALGTSCAFAKDGKTDTKAKSRNPAEVGTDRDQLVEIGSNYGFQIGKRVCLSKLKNAREYSPHEMVIDFAACPNPMSRNEIANFAIKGEADFDRLSDIAEVMSILSKACRDGLQKGISSCQ